MPHFGAIAGLGIELEGGQFPNGRRTKGWKEDASVHLDDFIEDRPYCDCDHDCSDAYCGDHAYECSLAQWVEREKIPDAGEVASPILRSWKEVTEFMHDTYPNAIDGSCGMHVHTSFKSNDSYSRVLRKSFIKHFNKKWKAYAYNAKKRGFRVGDDIYRLRDRLEGRNSFCQPNHIVSNYTLRDRYSGVRYVQLNYRWASLETVECRLLPMFDSVERALGAIGYLVKDVYNEYLKTSDKLREFNNKIRIEMDASDALERMIDNLNIEIDTSSDFIQYNEELAI